MRWNNAIYLVVVLVQVTLATPQPTVGQVHADLRALSDELVWKNSTHATYAPVLQAALKAESTLQSYVREADSSGTTSVPRANEFHHILGRLIVESAYLSKLSQHKNYTQSVLDSTMFLTGSVDEWRYTIAKLDRELEVPTTYIEAKPRFGMANGISTASAPGTQFCDFENAPTMVVVPSGSFTAGSTPAEQSRWNVPVARRDFELPQRRVHILKPLAFSRTEVTLQHFEYFVQRTKFQARGGARWWNPKDNAQMVFNPELSYQNPGFPQTDTHPVVAVTRQDARAYAQWLSTMTGARYRLPTEDEWEWAARGRSEDSFYWGNDLDHANQFANTYDKTSQQANGFYWPRTNVTDGFAYTAPVASFEPNQFGLYDMTGNAREFMDDDWVEHLGAQDSDGSVHRGPAPFPVVRGGAWDYAPQNLRINYRSAYFSSEVATNMFGIRLVREL